MSVFLSTHDATLLSPSDSEWLVWLADEMHTDAQALQTIWDKIAPIETVIYGAEMAMWHFSRFCRGLAGLPADVPVMITGTTAFRRPLGWFRSRASHV